jgi:3-phenylpropionate/trans-cinnamate dioxygenase ferredoxin subunit
MARIEVAPLAEFPTDSGLQVEVGEHRVAVFRVGDVAYALGDRCSHAEASLAEGDLYDDEVECPRHGAAFSLATGEALTLPATKAVPIYRTEVEDGVVFLTIDEES